MTSLRAITKTLSANDLGETGGHQSGILVPKDQEILSFFPHLTKRAKNPRVSLAFRDDDGITRWNFEFIYYNNRFFGGTRNEYRLTRMTKYLRSKNAKVGDDVILSRDADERLFITCRRASPLAQEPGVLRLSGGWKVIPIK
jgi:Restriction endonuclease EcoRII, N-terminal